MNDNLYDKLKFLAQIGLPALGTLYFTLAAVWGLPAAEQVVATIVAVDTTLGILLHISSSQYRKTGPDAHGTLEVIETDRGKTYNLELDGDPEYELESKDRVIFRVAKKKQLARRRPARARRPE